MRILIGCEYSATVRDAFRRQGYDAWSCDLLPSEGGAPHIQGNILDVIKWRCWDGGIFHPDCTFLTNSGVRWLHERPGRWQQMQAAAAFFNALKAAPMPFVAIENPIPHKHAVALIGKYDQLIQPWQFGHGETKAICLWLKGLPPLQHTNVVAGRTARVWRMGPSPKRKLERSRFYSGIGDAMASQWGPIMAKHWALNPPYSGGVDIGVLMDQDA